VRKGNSVRPEECRRTPVLSSNQIKLVINFKTANVLGLTVAPYLLARANEVIEWGFLAALHESKVAHRDSHLTPAIGSLRPSSGVTGVRLTRLYRSGTLVAIFSPSTKSEIG
jgi:hypothetical protein